MLSWLRSNPAKYQVYSNYPDIMYLYCQIWTKPVLGLDDFFILPQIQLLIKEHGLFCFFPNQI